MALENACDKFGPPPFATSGASESLFVKFRGILSKKHGTNIKIPPDDIFSTHKREEGWNLKAKDEDELRLS